jgi:hypothetical protein
MDIAEEIKILTHAKLAQIELGKVVRLEMLNKL